MPGRDGHQTCMRQIEEHHQIRDPVCSNQGLICQAAQPLLHGFNQERLLNIKMHKLGTIPTKFQSVQEQI